MSRFRPRVPRAGPWARPPGKGCHCCRGTPGVQRGKGAGTNAPRSALPSDTPADKRDRETQPELLQPLQRAAGDSGEALWGHPATQGSSLSQDTGTRLHVWRSLCPGPPSHTPISAPRERGSPRRVRREPWQGRLDQSGPSTRQCLGVPGPACPSQGLTRAGALGWGGAAQSTPNVVSCEAVCLFCS